MKTPTRIDIIDHKILENLIQQEGETRAVNFFESINLWDTSMRTHEKRLKGLGFIETSKKGRLKFIKITQRGKEFFKWLNSE